MTPKNLGWRTVGTFSPLISISKTVLASFENVVKMVADDLEGDMCRFRVLNHSSRTARYLFRSLTTGSTCGPRLSTFESSAYETRWMFDGGCGIDDIYRLKSTGESTPPCGTPCRTILYFDLDPLNMTYCCLPLR